MSSATLKKKMLLAQKLWKKAKTRAEEEGGFGAELEDGRYKAKIAGCSIGESQSSGRLQIDYDYLILEGESKGEHHHNYVGLETENNLMFAARDFARLGYEIPEDFDEVEAIVEELDKTKPSVRIRLKTKGEFQNTYVDGLLTGEEGEPDEEAESTSEDEGLPEEESAEAEAEPEEEPTAEESSEEVDLEIGMEVSFEFKGDTMTGTVLEIFEDEEKVRIEAEDGKKYRVPLDKLELLAGEETVPEEPEEEPEVEAVAPKSKKPTPKKSVVRKKPAPKKVLPKKKKR